MKTLNKLNLEVMTASKDETRDAMQGLCLNGKHSVSTDGEMITRVSYPEVNTDDMPVEMLFIEAPVEIQTEIIPQEFITKLLKLIPKKCQPILENVNIGRVSDTLLEAKMTDLEQAVSIKTKTIEGEFPDTESCMVQRSEVVYETIVCIAERN